MLRGGAASEAYRALVGRLLYSTCRVGLAPAYCSFAGSVFWAWRARSRRARRYDSACIR